MTKVISFSLWGTQPKYLKGAVQNVQLCRDIYPDWVARFYVDTTVPAEVLQRLLEQGAEVIGMQQAGNWSSLFWRFTAASDPNVEVMLSRDCDSRVCQREAAAVRQWLSSPKLFHIMRDHPSHDVAILGGMWGVKAPLLRDMTDLISKYAKGDYWQVDQDFLREVIYPRVKNLALVHDEFYSRNPFPEPRKGLEFVGQVFDENDCPLLSDQATLAKELRGRGWRSFWRKLRLAGLSRFQIN